mgnify:FL=1
MSGTLYVVGTPIGNLEDITLRQLRILEETDFIAAEDTRVTRKLLNHYEIKKEVISYHEHSTADVLESIIARLLSGESCAAVTDAGMPCISDPGEPLVKMCYEKNIPVSVVPGPSAVVSAVAVSGQHTARFTFEGFLSMNKKERKAHLESLKDEKRTMVFYEAPHKLVKTLADFKEYFGEERKISFCRELTKIHEEVKIMTVSEAEKYYEINAPRGEFVLVIEGKAPEEKKEFSLEDALLLVNEKISDGMKANQACKEVALSTGISKSVLYSGYHKEK